MRIDLVPRVCSQLQDQSLCQKAVDICGADTSPELCTIKLVGKAIADPEYMIVAKSLVGFGKKAYHVTMQGGHDYLHTFANDLVQNIGGDGKVGAVGSFIAKALDIGG